VLRRLIVFTAALALAMPAVANAVAPTIVSVAHQARHPVVTFTAPRADSLFVKFSTSPDRATDGSFLSENSAGSDSITDSELQSGRWMYEGQLDPGTYWVMLEAFPIFDLCYISGGGYDPACANGYSEIAKLVIPEPAVRYSVTSYLWKYSHKIDLTLSARPLGVDRAYKVCYRTLAKTRRCLNGRLEGYSWSSPATDQLSVNTRPLGSRTLFQWYVGSKLVAQKSVRTN
jgi:hypothetical protein